MVIDRQTHMKSLLLKNIVQLPRTGLPTCGVVELTENKSAISVLTFNQLTEVMRLGNTGLYSNLLCYFECTLVEQVGAKPFCPSSKTELQKFIGLELN